MPRYDPFIPKHRGANPLLQLTRQRFQAVAGLFTQPGNRRVRRQNYAGKCPAGNAAGCANRNLVNRA